MSLRYVQMQSRGGKRIGCGSYTAGGVVWTPESEQHSIPFWYHARPAAVKVLPRPAGHLIRAFPDKR